MKSGVGTDCFGGLDLLPLTKEWAFGLTNELLVYEQSFQCTVHML
jgi:hypothetical protein